MRSASRRKGNSVKERREAAEAADALIQEITRSVAARNVWEARAASRVAVTEARRTETRPEPVRTEVRVEPAVLATPAPAIEPAPARQPEARREAEKPVIVPNVLKRPAKSKSGMVLISFEDGGSFIGQHVANAATQLAARNVPVCIIGRGGFETRGNVTALNVGDCAAPDFLQSVQEFTRRAAQAFVKHFPPGAAANFTATGFEWTTIGALQSLAQEHGLKPVLSLHSLEAQRSDLTSDVSKRIQEIEADGLKLAQTVLLYDGKTADAARKLRPDAAGRLQFARGQFPIQEFNSTLDAGFVKARFEVGPVDPTILFIGDHDERHGPDVLMKAAATILKRNNKARFIFVGDGPLQWPLRVTSRYLLMDYATRIPGSVEGQALRELIQAVDIIAVPSRERTEEWPVLAAWAAGKPVVATHETAGSLLQHEKNAVLSYPNENSFVWGCERLLNDHALRPELGKRGRDELQARFGADAFAVQLQSLLKAQE